MGHWLTGASRNRLSACALAIALSVASAASQVDSASRIPTVFIENRGQFDDTSCLVARDGQVAVFCETGAFVVQLFRPVRTGDGSESTVTNPTDQGSIRVQGVNLRIGFGEAAAQTVPRGEHQSTGTFNYFRGADPAGWVVNVPAYHAVRYASVYPGIDAVLTLDGQSLRLSFDLASEADLSQLQLTCAGAEAVAVTASGELAVTLPNPDGMLVPGLAPIMVDLSASQLAHKQDDGGLSEEQPTKAGSGGSVVLNYSTFLGGSGFDEGRGVALQAATPAPFTLICGRTTSATMIPQFPGPFDTTFNGDTDAFVAKFSIAGNQFIHASYIGGVAFDVAFEVAVNGAGEAFVVGYTESSDFPVSSPAFDQSLGGPRDAFALKLNPSGSALMNSTYLGGSGPDMAFALALEAAGSLYIAGQSASADFPLTPGAFNTIFNTGSGTGMSDAFVTKLNPDGLGLAYSTYIAGNLGDAALDIALDASGGAHIVGYSDSSNLPTSPGALQPTFGGGGSDDGFTTSLNATGTALVHGSYLATQPHDSANGIAVDAAGSNIWVAGTTESASFPTTPGAYDTSFNGVDDAFVLKLAIPQSTLVYSTFIGGADVDIAWDVAVDSSGNAYAVGGTASTNYPTTPGAFDGVNRGGDAFASKLDAAGARLIGSTFLGGGAFDTCYDIALEEESSRAYLVGITWSSNFPTTPLALDQVFSGDRDAFMAKVQFP